MSELKGLPPGKPKSLFTELNSMISSASLETRAENACGVAMKFMSLLEESVEDEAELKKLKSAWFKSVRDGDFKKFKRALNRYRRAQEGETS